MNDLEEEFVYEDFGDLPNKKGGYKGKNKSRNIGETNAARKVFRLMLWDKNNDYTIDDLTEFTIDNNHTPQSLLKDPLRKLVKRFLREQAGIIKRTVVDKDGRKQRIRVYGCYDTRVEDTAFTSEQIIYKKVKCWKAWDVMTRGQMVSAQRYLYDMARNIRKEAEATRKYCNEILVGRGEEAISIDEVDL